MRRYAIPLPLPTEGINCIPDYLIGDRECSTNTKNITFKNSNPSTRKGYIKQNTHNFGANEVYTLLNYLKDGNRIALATSNFKLHKETNATTFTEIIGTLNSNYISGVNYPIAFASPDTYGDKIFILDGDNYRYFKDTGALVDVPIYTPTLDELTKYGTNVLSTTPDEIKHQKWVIIDNERFWVAGYKNLVRISHLSRPDYFPSNQVWKLSEDCTGIVQFSDEVIMFTEHTATLIKGSTPNWELPDKYVRKSLPTKYGCSQQRTICVGNSTLFWASCGGVFRYRQLPDGTYEPECISEIEIKQNGRKRIRTVQPIIESITDWSKTYAVFFENEYRLCLGDNRWLVFDTIGTTWAYYEYDKAFNCAITYLDNLYSAKSYYYNLDYTNDGTNYNGLSDDGTAIDFVLESKTFDFGKASYKKIFGWLYFTLLSQLVSYNIDLTLYLDSEYTKFIGSIINKISRFGELKFGDKLNTKRTNLNYPIRIVHSGTKYNIKYNLRCNTLNQAFSLSNIDLTMKVKELK